MPVRVGNAAQISKMQPEFSVPMLTIHQVQQVYCLQAVALAGAAANLLALRRRGCHAPAGAGWGAGACP